ncbi:MULTISPECIES: SCO3242 family prenyltransferase [Streptomyces]|uniref:UbiA family prenyltransferase n=1 Tax=Streptomyces lycii TaxID=2654337 RepID=A0ABQ7FK75_9ACTN|nr:MULTISPECIES: UbiA family prenyltransferase [Streptomyces]KAF4407632.1 UbiA family prenyltransferase [Streptomyces lycii]PGH47770.1 prenyltransferase [Streptomyces sp. Ru87]
MTDPHHPGKKAAWAELLRLSALFSVPGDAFAGAAAAGRAPNRGTVLAACASLCLYEAGMTLNDWADRDVDAVERPHRPLPSGRIAPGAAFGAAAGLTAAGLGLAAVAGRPALATATALAGAVWAYDLRLKNTKAGPAAMAAARALDLLMGAAATAGRSARTGGAGPDAVPRAFPAAALLGAHTYAVTLVSRRETEGGSSTLPLAALGVLGGIARAAGRNPRAAAAAPGGRAAPEPVPPVLPAGRRLTAPAFFAAGYAATAARPYAHAALNPSPYLYQRAVGGGIRAMIPLQAALAARSGRTGTAAALLALLPVARRLARKVSPT